MADGTQRADLDAGGDAGVNRRDQAKELRERLRDAYCKPGEVQPGVVFLTEVNAPRVNRRADALAVHLVRNKPYIDGIEIKVSRGDWLKELDDHQKADGWFAATHRWWIAASSRDIVHADEVPPGWGLMVPYPRSPRRMTTVVKPTVRDAEISHAALVEILKKVDNERADQVREATRGIENKVREELEARFQAQLDHARTHAVSVTDRHDQEIGKFLRRATGADNCRQVLAALQDPETSRIVRAVLAASNHREGARRASGDLWDLARRHAHAADALRSAAEAVQMGGDARIA